MRRSEPADGGDPTAIASLVLGIVAILSTFWIMAAVGVVFGIIIDLGLSLASLFLGLGSRRTYGGGIAVAGVIVGAIATAFALVWVSTTW